MNREKETVMITEKQYLEYLIKQYQNLIYSICLKSVGNPFDAEDLTQEVFLSAYKNLSRFDGNYEKAWLSKIAVRKCLDYLKAAGRRSIPTEDTYFSQIPDRQSSPEDEYMKTASNTHVEALCMQLKVLTKKSLTHISAKNYQYLRLHSRQGKIRKQFRHSSIAQGQC